MTRLRTDEPPPTRKSTEPRRARRPNGRRRPVVARVLTVGGVLLLVIGIGCLGYVGYQLFGTNITSERAQDAARDELRAKWEQQASEQQGDRDSGGRGTGDKPARPSDRERSTVVPGEATALLSIPAIGVDEVPVLEGTSDDALSRGVGHYADTAAAGEVGNFAVAGHRITHGEPFADLLELRAGDEVVVETRTAIFTYVIDEAPQKLTVQATETWVLDPVPGKPNAEPSQELITLTTCQDLFHSPDRSVGFGRLVDTQHK